MQEVAEDIESLANTHPHTIRRYLLNLEVVLASELPPGQLLDLVLWDANIGLENPTDEAAANWLKELANLMRGILEKKKG